MSQARKSVRSPDPNYGKLRKSRVTVINKGLLTIDISYMESVNYPLASQFSNYLDLGAPSNSPLSLGK